MAETVRITIVDPDDPDKVLTIVESTNTPWVYGIVILSADGSDL